MRLFWITIIALICIGLYFLAKSNKEAYESCVAEGRMSNDTCFQLAYM